MMQSYIDINRIHKLSKGDKSVPLYQKIIKLGEESGEVAQAFLEYDGAKNVSKSASAEEKTLGVLEECCDVLNVTMDIINCLTEDDYKMEQAVVDLFQKKLDKWESKQKKYNSPTITIEEIDRSTPEEVDIEDLPKPGVIRITQEDIEEMVPTAPFTEEEVAEAYEEVKAFQDNSGEITLLDGFDTEPLAPYKGADSMDEPKVNAPNVPKSIAHEFPNELYHSSGTKMTPYQGIPIYKPTYALKPNQRLYGVQGKWNVVVTFDGDKYISEHPQPHFNGQILTTEI